MLTPSLTSWRAHYDRMRRSYAHVTGQYTSSVAYDDDLRHFMQDCWHLKDWIKYDSLAGIGDLIEGEVHAYKSLRIIVDLANGSKHLNRKQNREGAYVSSTNVTVHFGQARPIDVDYVVTLSDGTCTSAEVLVHEAAKDWDVLLGKLRLIH